MNLKNLKKLLASYAGTGQQMIQLEALQKKSCAALDHLEVTMDLKNATALHKVAALRVQVDLIPKRLATLTELQSQTAEELLTAANDYYEQVVAPKIGAVWETAVAAARKTLSTSFTGHKLETAVQESSKVAELNQLLKTLYREADPADVVFYVRRRIDALNQAVKIQKSL